GGVVVPGRAGEGNPPSTPLGGPARSPVAGGDPVWPRNPGGCLLRRTDRLAELDDRRARAGPPLARLERAGVRRLLGARRAASTLHGAVRGPGGRNRRARSPGVLWGARRLAPTSG